LTPGNLLRPLGFAGDGSEIWLSPTGNPGRELVLMPLSGGMTRAFLDGGKSTPSWSADNTQLAYIGSGEAGDPLYLADRTGADARPLAVRDQGAAPFFRRGVHTHNPVWSRDGQWLYFVYGPDPNGSLDVWRVRASGEQPEQLTHQNAPVNFLAPLDLETVLYVARAEDWSGPWLWALDVESKVTRRVTVGLEQFTSVSASRDGQRVVATVANPTSSLWRVPLLDRLVIDSDAEPYPVPTARALAPRFAGASLFYLSLSARAAGDGLWRVRDGQAFEVRRGADGVLSEPPAVSPDGSRVAVVVRQRGQRRLAVMSTDGTNSRTLATAIEIQGAAGQGTTDWSPDGGWLVTGGRDAQGPGLFKIPVNGGDAPIRLVDGEARNPVWSPTGDLIVYATPFAGAGGTDWLRAVRPDGTPVELPEARVRLGGAHRFLPSGAGLVYLQSVESKDFWLLDLAAGKVRRLTDLSDRGYVNGFDITPDGQYLVFDRSRQNSDIVLIERPRP
jgi:Tol biopolymer transport system component